MRPRYALIFDARSSGMAHRSFFCPLLRDLDDAVARIAQSVTALRTATIATKHDHRPAARRESGCSSWFSELSFMSECDAELLDSISEESATVALLRNAPAGVCTEVQLSARRPKRQCG